MDKCTTLLRQLGVHNLSNESMGEGNRNHCSFLLSFDLHHLTEHHQYNLRLGEVGTDIYAYATPIIFSVGLLGNLFSLRVFTSKFMRRFSSSSYLVCLSASDIFVLLFYVFLDWLNRGLHRWPNGLKYEIVNYQGMCQIFLYTSYVFRFTSVYFMVLLSAERYVVLYYKRYRKKISRKTFARKAIAVVLGIALILSIYKPVLSGVHPTSGEGQVCMKSPQFTKANFILDTMYAVLITGVPFILIMIFSLPILHKVCCWKRENYNDRIAFKQNQIRLEFTLIQLSVSFCFICFNVPYFVTWCFQFWEVNYPSSMSNTDKLTGLLLITRTIFFLNYACKFFLYCVTGAYYRREIKSILFYYFRQNNPNEPAYHIPDDRNNTPGTSSG